MKKLSVFLAGLALALGVSSAQTTPQIKTGASLNTYSLSKAEGVYHELGADATILFQPDKDSCINNLFIAGQDDLVPVSVATGSLTPSFPGLTWRKSCIDLPGEMMFGTTAVRRVGITTDGFLYFGDSVRPAFMPKGEGSSMLYYLTNTAKTTNYVFFSLADVKADNNKYDKPTALYADAQTKIGYETKGDTIWIGYENILIRKASADVEQTLSWNYRIIVSTGEISLQTKGFYSSSEALPPRQFSYGLVGTKQAEVNFLSEFRTPRNKNQGSDVAFRILAKDSLTEGARYVFTMPENCEAVANPTIAWKTKATESEISLDGTTWTGSSNALFVLYPDSVLKATAKPEDGTAYAYSGWSCKVGQDKVPGLLGTINGNGSVSGLGSSYKYSSLQSDSAYYVYAYVYNLACANGPVYGEPVRLKVNTMMATPTVAIRVSDVQATSLKVVLPQPEKAGLKYVVAISETSMNDFRGNPAKGLLEYGKTYEVGDKAGSATIRLFDVEAGEHVIEGFEAGASYYISAWYVRNTPGAISYSAGYVETSVKMVTMVPAVLGFAEEEAGSRPAGWAMDDKTEFNVTTYGNDGGTGPFMAKAPADGTNVLYGLLYYQQQTEETATFPQPVHSWLVSPKLGKGAIDNVSASFELGFYTQDAMTGSISSYKLKEGDSVVISWAENQESDNWVRLCMIDKSFAVDAKGFGSVAVPAFKPAATFCFKVDIYHKAASSEDALGFALEKIIVEEDLPCKFPVNLSVTEEELTATSALVQWEDGNTTAFAESFVVKYRPEDEADWMEKTVDKTQISLTGLKVATPYVVSVKAVCGEESMSLEKTVGFTTLYVATIPYEYEVSKEGDLPRGSRNMRGVPGQDLVEIDAMSDEAGWIPMTDAAYDGMALANILDCNANTWLVMPDIVASQNGVARLGLAVTAWGWTPEYEVQEAKKTHDSIWVFMSASGDFKADCQLLGVVNIDSLHVRIDESPNGRSVRYDTVNVEVPVNTDTEIHLALYVPGKGAVRYEDWDFVMSNVLAVGGISLTYAEVEYPAVTNLKTEGVTQNSVTVSWQGQADSYAVLWKERAAQDYDTVTTSESKYTFTDLKKGTQYAYRVYGIYGTQAGQISPERYVTTMNDVTVDTVALPQFDRAPGDVAKGTVVSITCTTEGAQIFYTVDGSVPTTGSLRYTTGIKVDSTMTIKAIATKNGMSDSKVAEATYRVVVANEGNELVDVRVYPNPNDGRFNVVVPGRAALEVIASNGRLINRLDVPAGTTALRLDHAGIYFLRINVDGQVIIKKVVVR